jgi:hypothetical protein
MLAPLAPNARRQAVVRPATVPAPVEGWDASSALADMKKLRAVQLKNWFPQPGYVEMRRGHKAHAIGVGGLTGDVESLMPWNGPGSTRKMFAAAGGTIYDATSAASSQLGNDTYTKALLQCNGTDAATTFTDSNLGGSAHTWTAQGDAQIDTAQSKFGGASALFDGTGDYVSTPDHADYTLGTGAFTADGWVRPAADGSLLYCFGQAHTTLADAASAWYVARTAGNKITFNVVEGTTVTTVTSTSDVIAGAWTHVAVVRTGNTLKLFISGVQEGGDVAFSGTINNSTAVLSIGAAGAFASNRWNGWIDEFRFSVGVARWTTAFTPPTLAYAIASSSSLTSLSEDRWQWVNFTTSAGAYLYIVNGTDAPRHYNGSAWATPAITGITEEDAIHVCVHKKRIWFTLKDSTKAAYLATEAVAGAATVFELGSNFSEGGYLVGMATWTRDGGTGSDDLAAFVSSKGQVAIYQGTDPASVLTWELVGVFKVPTPIGRRCFANWGADVLLITESGVYPLSKVMAADRSQADLVAITNNISPAINAAARSYSSNFGWELNVYARGTRLVLNIPTSENATAAQYVMNTLTGAWCEFDGHNALCWLTFNGLQYFGGPDGTVYRADTSSQDGQAAITAVGQASWQAFGSPGTLKRFCMVQPLVRSQGVSRPSVGISADFVETTSLSTPSASSAAQALYGSAVYGVDVYGSTDVFVADWTSTPALGRYASIKFQASTEAVTAGEVTADPLMQINGFVVLAEGGGYI